jgi:hypothetical protein
MKPTAKHNDEALREAIELLAIWERNSPEEPSLRRAIRTVLASLESAIADTRRLDWLLSPDNRKVGVVDDVTEKWIYHRSGIDAAIDRAATCAEGEAK